MDFKPSEILTIVAVLLLPLGAFTFIFWPGAFGALMGVVNSPSGLPIVCGIGAAFAGLWILIRRLARPKRDDRP